MRVSTNQFHNQGFSAISQHQQSVLDIQEKLSTGKRINKPGDDPAGMNQVHSLNKTMGQIDQFKKNGEAAKAQLNLEETQLNTVVDVVQRARELSIQMMNGTYNEGDRRATAQEIGQLTEHLKNILNSSNPERELLFAGSNVNEKAAFVEDVNNPGYYAYIGSPNADDGTANTKYRAEANYGSRFVQISFDADNRLTPDDQGDPSRVRITDNGAKMFNVPYTSAVHDPNDPNYDAAEVFNPNQDTIFTGGVAYDGSTISDGTNQLANQPDRNILNLMVELKAYLDNGQPPPGSIGSDLSNALVHVSENLAEIGGRQNRIEAQYDAGESFKLALEERRMNIEDMDVVEGISTFTMAQNALQMAQQVFAKVQEMSLFNYIR